MARSIVSGMLVVAGGVFALAGAASFLSDALGHGAEPGLEPGDAIAAAVGVGLLLLGLFLPGRPPSPAAARA